jgi:hypothetical protein
MIKAEEPLGVVESAHALRALHLKEKARKQDHCDRAMEFCFYFHWESHHPPLLPRLHVTNSGAFSYWAEVHPQAPALMHGGGGRDESLTRNYGHFVRFCSPDICIH